MSFVGCTRNQWAIISLAIRGDGSDVLVTGCMPCRGVVGGLFRSQASVRTTASGVLPVRSATTVWSSTSRIV